MYPEIQGLTLGRTKFEAWSYKIAMVRTLGFQMLLYLFSVPAYEIEILSFRRCVRELLLVVAIKKASCAIAPQENWPFETVSDRTVGRAQSTGD